MRDLHEATEKKKKTPSQNIDSSNKKRCLQENASEPLPVIAVRNEAFNHFLITSRQPTQRCCAVVGTMFILHLLCCQQRVPIAIVCSSIKKILKFANFVRLNSLTTALEWPQPEERFPSEVVDLHLGDIIIRIAKVAQVVAGIIDKCSCVNARGAWIACWSECWTCDRSVASSNPGRSGGRIFFSRVNFVC